MQLYVGLGYYWKSGNVQWHQQLNVLFYLIIFLPNSIIQRHTKALKS